MEGPSNGGMLYHEVQESKLCAVHCVNTVLQGPFFSEIDLAALASDLDLTEMQMMNQGSSGDFSLEDSHNVSLGGDFSIQVLEKALGVWDLQVIPFNSPVAEASNCDPELETAFICHLHDHWFCIRKVNGEWYNFNSLYAAPEHLSKFYLSAFLDTLRGSGWSIFLVRGNFPKDCPIPSSNAFGQWLTPEDAQRITKSCNEMQAPSPGQEPAGAYPSQFMSEADALAAQEEHDLNAAIAASLLESNSKLIQEAVESSGTSITQDAAIAASLMASAFGQGAAPSKDVGHLATPATVGSQLDSSESGITPATVGSQLDSSESGINAANSMSDEAIATVASDHAEVRQPETLKSIRGRNQDAILAACLYIACRQEDKPRTVKEICSVANGASKKEIGRAKEFIVKQLEVEMGQSMEMGTIHAGDFLRRFCSHLGMTNQAVKAAQEAVQKSEELDIRRSPISIAAAVIYIITQLSDDKKPLKDISLATGVAEGTIRNSYKDLYPYVTKIIPASYAKEEDIRNLCSP